MAADPPEIDSLWNYSDNAGSEARFRAALPATEVSGNVAYRAELLTQLARAIGRQGRFKEGFDTIDQAAALMRPGMWRVYTRFHLEYGRLLNSSGEPDRALPYFENALEFANIAKTVAHDAGADRLLVDAAHMIAIVQKDAAGKIDWNKRAIALAEERDQRGWLYALYNNLGEAYAADSDFENALATFRKLVALDLEKGKSPDVYAQKDVAKMLRLLGRYDQAMELLRPIAAALAEPNGYIEEELAECLLATQREAEAGPHFARAFDLQKTDPWVATHEAGRLARLERLGKGQPGVARSAREIT